MALLYQCQEVARLLELEWDELFWIDMELEGYPPQDLNSLVEQDEAFGKYRVPYYRILKLPAKATTPIDSAYPFQVQYQDHPMTVPFHITSPCGELENADKPISISFDMVLDAPKETRSLAMRREKKIPARFSTTLSVDKMRGIAYAIRGRVNRFASSHHIALSFETSLSSMVDATRNLLADKLQKIHPPTLDFIEETLKKQECSTDAIQWRDVLENTRTILRRLTGILLKEGMIPEGKTRPPEGETKNKTRMILNWVRLKLGEDEDRELDHLTATLDVIQTQKSTLIGLINKLGHGEVDRVSKGEVDRVLLTTITWTANLIHILDKAGYNWD